MAYPKPLDVDPLVRVQTAPGVFAEMRYSEARKRGLRVVHEAQPQPLTKKRSARNKADESLKER